MVPFGDGVDAPSTGRSDWCLSVFCSPVYGNSPPTSFVLTLCPRVYFPQGTRQSFPKDLLHLTTTPTLRLRLGGVLQTRPQDPSLLGHVSETPPRLGLVPTDLTGLEAPNTLHSGAPGPRVSRPPCTWSGREGHGRFGPSLLRVVTTVVVGQVLRPQCPLTFNLKMW